MACSYASWSRKTDEPELVLCPSCRGFGYHRGEYNEKYTCKKCKGSGMIVGEEQ